MFTKSVDVVMQRLGEAERSQASLAKVVAGSSSSLGESEIQVFRNQLKVSDN